MPLPAPIAAPAPSADPWTTVGKAGKAIKRAVKTADTPARQTRHSPNAPPLAKPAAVPVPPATPPVRTTRHSIQKGDVSVAELAEQALERGEATPRMAQIIVEHLLGDDAPASLKGDTVESILERVAEVPYKPRLPQFAEDLEASGTQIEYVTKAGTKAVMDQPKGYAQVMSSPDRDAWLEASRESFLGLKNVRGNRMRREDEATLEGPIFDVVSVYKCKLDPATNMLDRVTVRHNVDGNRGKRVLAKRGIAYGIPTSSTTLDEIAFKMMVSDAANRQRFLTKAYKA